jgi:16S rRNA processing protein RimM
LTIGRIVRAHGIRGDVVVVSESPERFVPGAVFDVGGGGVLVVLRSRIHGRAMIVSFEGVADRDAAERLRGTLLSVTERRTLGSGEFWPEDLEGLEVRDPEGRALGVVSGVILSSAQDRLVVRSSGRDHEVPFVVDLVPEVRPDAGFIVVDPIDGLLS